MNLIVAVCSNNGIGFNKGIPWKLKKDLIHFKNKTLNNVIIMGRKTYESLPISPLPGRINIVLTRKEIDNDDKKTIFCKDFNEALEKAKEFNKEIFIIGGSEVYKEALKHEDLKRIYYTYVKSYFECDTFFPKIPKNFIKCYNSETKKENEIEYEFQTYERKGT